MCPEWGTLTLPPGGSPAREGVEGET